MGRGFTGIGAGVSRLSLGRADPDFVEQPTKYECVVNLKTAKALSLPIPLSVLARTDDLIE